MVGWLCHSLVGLVGPQPDWLLGSPGDSDGNESEVAQSYPTLCIHMDCSLPGSSVHGIFQARVLQWLTISFSRGSSWPRDGTQVSHIAGKCFTIWVIREAPDGKESSCNTRDQDSIPGLGRSPGGGHGNPLQYSCPEKPHGQRNLVGYSSWGLKELDTTDWLCLKGEPLLTPASPEDTRPEVRLVQPLIKLLLSLCVLGQVRLFVSPLRAESLFC